MATPFLFTNFFLTELLYGIDTAQTSIEIPPTDSFKMQAFTLGQFYAPLYLWDGQNQPEIVWCTANPQTGTLTILRGQEGSSPFGWSSGTQIRSSITAAVLNAALQAYNSGLILVANYLPLTGGTLTGPLTLSGLETLAAQAASRAYVASQTAGFLSLSGGTMTGDLNVAGHRIMQLPDPTGLSNSDAATKGYVLSFSTAGTNTFADRSGAMVTAGTGAAYLATSFTGYSAGIPDGTQIAVRLHATNRLNATLALDTTAAVPIRIQAGVVPLPPGILVLNSIAILEYHAAVPEWIVIDHDPIQAITTTGGTINYALTTGFSITTLEDGLEFLLQINIANTGPTVLNVDGLGGVPLRPATGVEYGNGALNQYTLLPIRYNGTTNEWIAKGAPPTPISTNSLSFSDLTNVRLSATQISNVLTVSLKANNGADPSVANPVNIPFADPFSDGLPIWRQVTAPLSIATVVGATFGIGNNVPFRLWCVIFDDSGVLKMALSLRTIVGQIFGITESNTQSSVAMSSGSTSAGVWYTNASDTPVSSKSFRTLGYVEFPLGLATAGSFNAGSFRLRLFGAGSLLPGQEVQRAFNYNGVVATGSTAFANANTIPPNTSGDQYMTESITPTFQGNLLEISHVGNYAIGATAYIGIGLFQDAIVNALAASFWLPTGLSSGASEVISLHWQQLAAGIISTTFKIRAGSTGGSIITFNGTGGSGKYGGVLSSYLMVKEIMA